MGRHGRDGPHRRRRSGASVSRDPCLVSRLDPGQHQAGEAGRLDHSGFAVGSADDRLPDDAVVIIPGNSRIVRGAVLSAKQNRYVEAAQAIGCRHQRIILTHILPNVTAPILVIASIWLGNAILIEATLSFLGVGTQPPTPSWGLMLSSTGRAFIEQAPWLAIFPGLAISLAVLAFNLLGDTLRDAWDPKLRRQG
jgi:ABC-type antimicrobial peptide transport system permease subunit